MPTKPKMTRAQILVELRAMLASDAKTAPKPAPTSKPTGESRAATRAAVIAYFCENERPRLMKLSDDELGAELLALIKSRQEMRRRMGLPVASESEPLSAQHAIEIARKAQS